MSFERIEEKRNQADNIQKIFNEWILENKEDLFREFMKKGEVKRRMKEIQT